MISPFMHVLVFLESCLKAFLIIDSQVARSSSMPPNSKDALYQNLLPGVKSALRSKLLSFHVKDEVLLFPLVFIFLAMQMLQLFTSVVICLSSLPLRKLKMRWRRHCSGWFQCPLIQPSMQCHYFPSLKTENFSCFISLILLCVSLPNRYHRFALHFN